MMCRRICIFFVYTAIFQAASADLNSDLECRFTQLGSAYKGSVSQTASGRQCQRWDAQTPHSHSMTSELFSDSRLTETADFCRNPGGVHPEGVWCFTTDADVEWEYCDVPMCECRVSEAGWDYAGNVSVTEHGKMCQRWDSQTPHGHTYTNPSAYPDFNITLAENYCRNPATWWGDGTWCYTTDSRVRWQHCDIPMCECKVQTEGLNYLGKVNQTSSGLPCQAWSSQTPHEHSYTDDSMFPDGSISDAENFCRNPDDDESGGPWCFTTDRGQRWEYCRVPLCEYSLALTTTPVPSTLPTTTSYTGPTPTIHSATEAIGVAMQECKFSKLGTSYDGTRSETVSGKACQQWSSQTPHAHNLTDAAKFPEDTVEGASNNCRNPDWKPLGPWCFTTDASTTWEYCDVPLCECVVGRRGANYTGLTSHTRSNYTCQRWASQSPHRHTYGSRGSIFPEKSVSAAGNNCRNPGNYGRHPWCYTTRTNVRWEYCDIPLCECSPDQAGLQYEGQIAVTTAGKDCQRWDSQNPHSHHYYDDSMFPEGSATDAANYCRNPDDEETGGPWCYTTDPNTRWQYCTVPVCELDQIPVPSTTTTSTTTTTTTTTATTTTQTTTTTTRRSSNASRRRSFSRSRSRARTNAYTVYRRSSRAEPQSKVYNVKNDGWMVPPKDEKPPSRHHYTAASVALWMILLVITIATGIFFCRRHTEGDTRLQEEVIRSSTGPRASGAFDNPLYGIQASFQEGKVNLGIADIDTIIQPAGGMGSSASNGTESNA